jgi:large subunit ribosomal protein L25
VVTIAFDGTSQTALLKEMQRDPRSGQIIHVGFQAVSMEETVTSVVPVRFVGESHAAAKLGGVMTHPITQLRVEARAVDLPDVIEVDLTPLEEMHSSIKVADLPAASTYRVLDPAEQVLAVVLPPKVEVEEVEAAEAAEAEAAEEAAEAAPPGVPEAQATEEAAEAVEENT